MQITDKTAVSIHYTLTNNGGEELDSSVGDAPLEYLHGTGNISPGLEEALTGKKAGDKLMQLLQPIVNHMDDRMMADIICGRIKGYFLRTPIVNYTEKFVSQTRR